MDAAQLVAAVQQLQAGVTELREQLPNSRLEAAQAREDRDEMVDRIKSRYFIAFAELLAKCNSET